MKTLAQAAMDLPWLAPSVASLLTLARSPLSSGWTQVRHDPGIVLLTAQALDNESPFTLVHDAAILDRVLEHAPHFSVGVVDWNATGCATIHRNCYQHAALCSHLAEKLGCSSPRAWIAGFLAPLAWLGIAAVDAKSACHASNTTWQRQHWGLDGTALIRRLSRAWRLPAWLTSIIGQLGLPVETAARLGAEPRLFQLVQLTIRVMQNAGAGFAIPVSAETDTLLNALQLSAGDVDKLVAPVLKLEPPGWTWEAPARQPLLLDVLHLARENRRQQQMNLTERLQDELDRLHEILGSQCTAEKTRLQRMKLSALAEFAAGAGHEINNPLAVISGQAQYVLKQTEWLNVPSEEIEDIAEYLGNLRTKISPSLHKIIAQTQRVHSILTELMQFARPSTPKLQAFPVCDLIDLVVSSLEKLAKEHEVQLIITTSEPDAMLLADLAQMRTALAGLVRNAIEAAPAGGWAGVRIVKHADAIEFIVEDNGDGPSASVQEHLFDPFFSGRIAGRGRGMGLPIAWRFANQQGGDVRFEGCTDGVTRFVLRIPCAPPAPPAPRAEAKDRNGAHSAVEVPV